MKRRLALLLACCLALTACAGAREQHGGGGGAKVEGGTVRFALPPSATPNWLLPIAAPGYTASYNSAIYSKLFVPLYDYNGSSGAVALDERASAAEPPEYSKDGKRVTVTLKRLTWSDGKPVTTRDVEFWFNLIRANKKEWGAYTSGLLPDNVTSFHAVDDRTFTLTLDKAYNPDWFTANQLVYVYPLPRHAWGRTGQGEPVGNADRTTRGAKQVFEYLVGEAKKLSTYSTNPLWKTVDGPFRLKQFTATGRVTLERNPDYTGDDAAHLDTVEFQTFTSAAAEYNVLRAGGTDYGYLPTSNMGQTDELEEQGYRISPWEGWSITYIPYNFNNPDMGAVFKQLYVRQAIQHAVDQQAISRVIWRGTAMPGYGPVPQDNDPKYLSETQRNNPYPFDPARARELLRTHGWQPGDDGVLRCEGDCGKGIERGTRLSINLLTESGSDETDGMMQELKSSLSKIGIELRIDSQPLNTVLAKGTACEPAEPSCAWQLSFFGTQGSWYFPAYPSGEQLFATDASVNFGTYTDRRTDELIHATTQSDSNQAMRDYSARLAKRLPVIWMPNPPYQVSAIDSALGGVEQDPLAGLQPQRWYWTKEARG